MPRGGFLGKVDKEFKKVRNDNDSQVDKCKDQIDRINKLNGSKITYNRETAYVEVPRYDGLTENFKWAWLTSTTGSHKEIIPIFKQILNALEALKIWVDTGNPTPFLDLSSVLVVNANNIKGAFKANVIKLYGNDEGERHFKNSMDAAQNRFKQDHPELTTQTVASNDLNVQEVSKAKLALDELKYCIKAFDITQKMRELVLDLDGRNMVAFYLEARELEDGERHFNNVISDALNKGEGKTYSAEDGKLFAAVGITHPLIKVEEVAPVVNTSDSASEPEGSTKGEHLDENSDDDIEVISQLLESKVTLNNGKKIEVKKIIDAIYNPQDLDFYLRKLTPETNQLVKKEIALKLAYDLYNDSKELSVVSAISETLGISEEFNNYTDFSLAELKDEEVNITGGDYSYLE